MSPGPLDNMADVQNALAFIQKTGTTGGGSLFDNLTNLVSRVLEERPSNPVDLLETALLVKKANKTDLHSTAPLVPVTSAADAAKAVAAANLYGTPEVPIDPETGEPVDADSPNEYECEDVVGDGVLFDALGVGLGREEMMNVALAVKRLGEDPKLGVATVRFFGKFLGIASDYYVFETTLSSPPDQPEETLAEGEAPTEWGAGSNGYIYFCCSYLGGPMSQLPHVTPKQVKVARSIKKLLTGRLSSQVSAYPVFPGTEANYLRAQIARIAATTVACPAGLFVANEDGGLDKAEEFSPLPAREMGASANWNHRYPHLKKQGRCAVFKREPPEGEDEDSMELTEEEAEEGPEPLAPLEGDAEVAGAASWTPLFSSSAEHVKNQVAGLRSNQWPGAYCACQGSHFSNIYVGWGIKAGPFVPMPPPPVAKEYDQALVESAELPPKPAPPAEDEEQE